MTNPYNQTTASTITIRRTFKPWTWTDENNDINSNKVKPSKQKTKSFKQKRKAMKQARKKNR